MTTYGTSPVADVATTPGSTIACDAFRTDTKRREGFPLLNHVQFKASFFVLALVVLAAGCKTTLTNDAVTGPDDPGGDNTPPALSGSPDSSIRIGDDFSFTPSAYDADGDALSFSVANAPSWTSFDNADGTLTGMPLMGDEGLYRDVRITASDGEEQASLSFDITVNAAGIASISLAWTAPTENEDGSTLTDLAGYHIYYGRESGNYTDEIEIDNPSISSVVIGDLTPATYFISATAFNADGTESVYASEISAEAR